MSRPTSLRREGRDWELWVRIRIISKSAGSFQERSFDAYHCDVKVLVELFHSSAFAMTWDRRNNGEYFLDVLQQSSDGRSGYL